MSWSWDLEPPVHQNLKSWVRSTNSTEVLRSDAVGVRTLLLPLRLYLCQVECQSIVRWSTQTLSLHLSSFLSVSVSFSLLSVSLESLVSLWRTDTMVAEVTLCPMVLVLPHLSCSFLRVLGNYAKWGVEEAWGQGLLVKTVLRGGKILEQKAPLKNLPRMSTVWI